MRRYCTKKSILVLWVVPLTLVLGFAIIASGDNGALTDFKTQYPANSFGNSCSICHASVPKTNPYGTDLVRKGATANNIRAATFVAVEGLDSDGDGFTNLEEIDAGTFPGNRSSHPTVPGAVITITAPIAGQLIPSGAPFTVLYDASAEVSSVKVRYSLDGGASWLPAAGALGTLTGSFDWDVPTLVRNTTRTLVRVTGFNASNVKVASGKSDAFTIEVASITAPAPDETVGGGSVYPVTWITNGTKDPVANASVFYTVGSSGIWKRAIGSLVDPLGSFSWNVPSSAKPKIVKLKVILKDSSGVSVGIAVSKAFLVQ